MNIFTFVCLVQVAAQWERPPRFAKILRFAWITFVLAPERQAVGAYGSDDKSV